MTRPLFAAPLLAALVACSSASTPPSPELGAADSGTDARPSPAPETDAGGDAAFALPACTQSPPSGIADGTVSATGTFPPAKAILVAGYADAWSDTTEQPGHYSRTLHVTLVDHAGACASTLYHRASEHRLAISVYDENGAGPLGPLTPQTIPLDGGTDAGGFDRSVIVNAYASDPACTGDFDATDVRGGTITITAIDATHVAGSFDLDFHYDATRYQGTFDVPICPTSIEGPPEGQCCAP